MARFKLPKGTYPEALRSYNERRHRESEIRREVKLLKDASIITVPVGTLAGGYYLEDFSRYQLSTRTAKNLSHWMNAYRGWLEGDLGKMDEFRQMHGSSFVVQGERFYWITDYKNLRRIADTRDAYDLVFYGEREFNI